MAGLCQICLHNAPQSHTAPGIAAQWSEQGGVTLVTFAVWRGGRHQLTLSDSLPMRGVVGNKCTRPVKWSNRGFSLPRGVSNEAELPPRRGPAEGSAEGASGKAEICLRFEGPRRGGLERSGVCSTVGGASEESYRGAGPWAECVFGPLTLEVVSGHPNIDVGTAPGGILARALNCALRV